MNITPEELAAEYERALKQWPFIPAVEREFKLPVHLLMAVGSRETNLTNEVGDGGHGHGVWQLDDRSHNIPDGFDGNVRKQCYKAAGMLAALIHYFRGSIGDALAAYNAGAGTVNYNLEHHLDIDTGTANNDYSKDTLDRLTYLQNRFPVPQPPEHKVQKYTIKAGDTLWSIAQRFYGEGSEYLKIWHRNRHKIGPDPAVIKSGETIVIPK